MKLSSAAITVAAISLLSSTHAAPLALRNGEITGRLHLRRGSDLSEISGEFNPSRAIEDLNMSFEPGSSLILPRIVNFIKRQLSNAATSAAGSDSVNPTHSAPAGTPETTNLRTSVMTPDLESYGFASEGGLRTALSPVMEVKE